jgi:carboxylesterase type B
MESEAASFSNGSNSWDALIAALDCGTEDPLTCARAAPATTIKNIIEMEALSFGPVVDNITETGNVRDAITSGTAADIPILIGTNANEGSIFALEFGTLDAFIAGSFGGSPPAFTDAILAAFPRSEFPTDLDIIAAIITQVTFQCAAATIANLTEARGLPVFRYFFNGSFPNAQPIPNAGAFHSSEIAEVFNTFTRTGATVQQARLALYMNAAWANFAKDPFVQPMPNWPRLGSKPADLLTLQAGGISGGPAVPQDTIDFNCPLFAPVYLVTGL